MLSLLVVLRFALAALFCAAAAGKLLDPQGARTLAVRYRLPRGLGRTAAAVPAVELAVAVALVLDPSSRVAGAAAAVLIAVFSAFTVRELRSGRTDGCACFGRLGPESSARTALVRNGALLVVSLAVAASPTAPSPLAATAFGLVLVAGSLAAAVRGRLRSLPTAEHRLLLFLDPDCAPCRSLLPVLRGWSARAVDLQVVTRAGAVVDEEFARSLPSFATVVVDAGERARRYDVEGTPTAVVLDEDGRVRRTVVGVAGVEALLAGAIDDDRRRLDALGRVRLTLDRRTVLALGAGSAVAMALPGTSLGAELTTALSGHTGVNCPSCGDCIICTATGSPVKITCRPCKQKCSTRALCVNYANKFPAYLQLASYLQSKGFTQSHDSIAQGLQQNGKLTVLGTVTEFAGSSTATPRAALFYNLANSGGSAAAVLINGKGRIAEVAVAGSGGRIVTAPLPPPTIPKSGKKRRTASVAAGYDCGSVCSSAISVAAALASIPSALLLGPELAAMGFALSLFSSGLQLAGGNGPNGPINPANQYALDVLSALSAGSVAEFAATALANAGNDKVQGTFCDQFVCTYALQACCSYGSCYDSLTACAKSCPESLKYQAPCLVYLTGHGARTYLGRF